MVVDQSKTTNKNNNNNNNNNNNKQGIYDGCERRRDRSARSGLGSEQESHGKWSTVAVLVSVNWTGKRDDTHT
jgi:hypothetical protein